MIVAQITQIVRVRLFITILVMVSFYYLLF